MAKENQTKTKRPTAQKRQMQNEKRRLINRSFRSEVRTIVREFESALTAGDAEQKQATLKNVYSVMDKCVKRGIYSLSKASRTKARLTARASA